jgi:hypothetical protein
LLHCVVSTRTDYGRGTAGRSPVLRIIGTM